MQRLECNQQENKISKIYNQRGKTMFDGLLSKFKRGSSKKAPKFKQATTKEEGSRSGNPLMLASIGLIVLGSAAIAFEYVTTSDAPPTPQKTAPKPPMKPATQVKPASAPTAVNK